MTNSTRQAGDHLAWLVGDGGVGSFMTRSEEWIDEVRERGVEITPLIPASDLEQVSRERDEAVRLLREMVGEVAYHEGEGGRRSYSFGPFFAPKFQAARAFLNTMDDRDGGGNV